MRSISRLCLNNGMSYSNVGRVWTATSFADYLKQLPPPSWCKAICIHHTAFPDLAMRPKGLMIQHIENMRYGYINERKWSAGPHFFTDEDQIFGMTPPTEKGVHAVSFNSVAIGIEMLGDFDSADDPKSGRGAEVIKTTVAATKTLLNWLNLPATKNTILFHRDDHKTTKTCPGKKVDKDWFIDLVNKTNVLSTPLPVASTVDGVVDYVVRHKGYTLDEAKKLLRREGQMFFFGNDWLEGAYYATSAQRTVAPVKELELIIPKCSC